jgi:ribose-phosphate pyrophosphokinase
MKWRSETTRNLTQEEMAQYSPSSVSRPCPLVFGTSRYQDLTERVLEARDFEAGELERKVFPDGEIYLRYRHPVIGRDVVIIGGTASDRDTLELYDLGCAAAKYGARSLTLVIPYFGYSTMERAIHPGEIVTAKTRARLFSAIPQAAISNRVLLMDLHTEGINHYFEGELTPVHIYAQPVISAAALRLGGEDFVLACTDAGRAKWVESLANGLGVPAAFVLKRRRDDGEVELAAVSAQVEGARVVIYDDMIRSGGSLLQAARAYRDAGATSVCAVATHGILPAEGLEKIQSSGLIEKVVVTDSHPRARELESDFLEVESVAEILAAEIGGGMP